MSHSTNTTTTAAAAAAAAAAATNTTSLGNTAVMQQQVCVSSAIEDGNDAAVLSSRPLHDGHRIISRVFTHLLSYLSVFRFQWAQTNSFLPCSASTEIPRTTTNHGPTTSSNITSVSTLPPPPDSHHVITIDGSTTDGSVTDASPSTKGQKQGVNKEISTVTKLMFTVSVGAILLNANGSKEYNSVAACVERTIHLMAIILMILGIYIRLHWPTSSKWLQTAGNFFMRSVLPRQADFSKALYIFDIGQNDLSVAFRTMNDNQIRAAIPNIIDQFSYAVQHLYEEGARSFWIHNTGPIGCLPVQTFYNLNPPPRVEDQYGCLNKQNDKAIEFNKQLKDAVTKLRTKLPEAAITYVDMYAAKYGLISRTKSLGWADPKKVCCGYHEKYDHVWCGTKGVIGNGTSVTSVYGAVCSHPELHASWDGVHYTEAANHWFANHILNGALSDPPIPISHACYRA